MSRIEPDLAAGAASAAQPASPRRFVGKTAVVTGASDRGIGGAIAERLAAEGCGLWLVSRSSPQRLLKRLARQGREACWSRCDITHVADIRQAVQDCEREFGKKIDLLVNNAGIEVARPLEELTDSELRDVLETNLTGAIQFIRAALPSLSEPGGVIVNIASALALGGCPGFAAYSASKAGLVGLTQSLGWELAPRGIRVVGVAPGLVLTPMIRKHVAHLTADVWKQIEACHPLGMGLPHDVAAAVAFLASPEARWITGVTLPLGWAPHYPLPVERFLE